MLRRAPFSYHRGMEERGPVLARRTLLVIGILVAVAGIYPLTTPIDANDFERATGVGWTEFRSANPEPAAYLEREARLLGVSFVFLGIAAAGMATTVLKKDDRGAWTVAWFLPLALAGVAAVFFGSGGSALGAFYAVAAVVAGIPVAIGTRAAT